MRRPAGRGRRWTRLALLALVGLACLGIGASLVLTSQDTSNELMGAAGCFAGLASLAVSLAQLPASLPPSREPGELADFLAATVREQWEEEVTARRLRDPRVIPLTWSATTRPVAGPPETVVGPSGARILRLSMNGRLDGRFDDAAVGLARGYRQVPSGRLVVLGEPGAGKTVLALMLALGLLRERLPHAPVPVLLSVSTWDPVSESLDDWIVDTLATAYYGGRDEVPRRLVAQRLLLPVLDGLDEIPETARRSAVRAVDQASVDGRGIVLTCRSAEYEDVIEGGSPVLRRAPVVEIAPVAVADALGYLQDVGWGEGGEWRAVYARLAAEPAGPLAAALSTPLMLSLVRTVYRRRDGDLSALLGLDNRHAVEDHIMDHVVAAAYAPPRDVVGRPGEADAWRRQAEQAERWLTYLATYLHQHRERDLAWWLMSRRLLSRWSGLALGLALGLGMMIAVVAVTPALGHGHTAADDLPGACVIGGTIAVLAMITWYAAPDRAPGRLSLAARGSLARLRRGAGNGLVLVAILTVPLLATAAVVISIDTNWSAGMTVTFFEYVTGVIGGASAFAVTLAAHSWLDAPPERSTGASPLGLLRQDRTSSLAGASIAAVVLGVLVIPMVILGLSAGWMATNVLTGSDHQPLPTAAVGEFARRGHFFSTPITTAASTVLPAAVFFLLILTTRAWPRFALVRLVLAARGRLPWHLTRFLADARERELLRQSAGTYQFRHIRLQERLANRSLARDRVPARAGAVRRLRVRAAVACVAVLAACLALVQALPTDSSQAILLTGSVDAMAFTQDGKDLVTLDGDRVRWWDTGDGRELRGRRARIPYVGDPPRFISMTAEADGNLILAKSGGLVNSSWDELNGTGAESRWYSRFRQTLAGQGYVGIGYLPLADGGRYIALPTRLDSIDRLGTEVVDLKSAAVVHHMALGSPAALSADGNRLVTDGYLQLLVLDLSVVPPSTVGVIPDPHRTSQLAMSGDGGRLAVADGSSTQIYDAAITPVGKPLTGPTQRVDKLALSSDGRLLAATSGRTTRIWSL